MLKLIKYLILVILISAWIFFWKYESFLSQKVSVDFVDGYMTVEKGETFQSVLSKIFWNDFFVKLYLRQNPPDFSLQAGKYNISSWNIENIIESFKKPLNESDEYITFLEGWNIYDIDKTLTEKWLITTWDFSEYATNCEQFCILKNDYSFLADASSLEWFLYPDTYAINPENFTLESLVKKMLDNFQSKVIDSGIISDMGSIEILDLITLASIVQKEANKADNPEEIAIVAGILKKRLEEGWMLGADATVCYAHKIATQDCSPSIVLEYLYEKNDYNTRQMTGLPATPIDNPEAEIINATLNSQNSPYYYYLHDNSGQIHYGITGVDHEANKQKYLY